VASHLAQVNVGWARDEMPYEDRRIPINLSVWATLASLREYVYRSEHAAVMRNRRQ